MLFNVLTNIMMYYLLYCFEKFIIYVCVCVCVVAFVCVKFIGFTWSKYLVFVDLQSVNILYIICRYISNPSP